MPKIVREDLGNQSAVLTVTIDRESYEPKFNETLKTYRNKIHQKGFRKGKTPVQLLRKMYGQSVLVDVVNEMMQDQIVNYLGEHEADFIGQPIPSTSQEQVDFDYKDLKDYEFKFDIGIMPEFEIKGLDGSKELEMYKIIVEEKQVEDELENARRRAGTRIFDEEKIVLGDLIKLDAKELEGDAVREGGVANEFSVMIDSIADEALKNELLTKKKRDTVRFNVFELEKDTDEKAVKRYFLGLSEEDAAATDVNPMFEAEITEVSRMELAEMNEDFFEQLFGEGEEAATNEEEAKEMLRNKIAEAYIKSTEGLLFRDLQDHIMAENASSITFPDEYMKRWLTATNEQNTAELIENEYEGFAENMRWTLIRNKLLQQHEIKVEEEDIRQGFANQIMQYMGGYGDASMINGVVDRMMGNREQVEKLAGELATDKLFEKLQESIKIKDNPVSVEDFQEIVRKINEEMAAKNAAEEEE